MARGLDHIVHAVRDLDAAAAMYKRLGFTVGGRNRHPWGTHNRIVQLSQFFVELLTVAEPDRLGSDGFSVRFGKFNRDFLARGEGLSLLILESRDITADADQFRTAGIDASEVMRFEREGKRPDGSPVTVAFSLVFVRDPKAPDIGFAVCQQHFPQNFWNPAVQRHANTAARIAGVVLVAENPSDHHIFLSAFTGERDLTATSSGVTVTTPRGVVQAMSPVAFLSHFGVEPPAVGNGARLAALRFAVRDFSAAVSALQAANVAASMRMGRIVIAPQTAMGATIVLEPDDG